MAHSFYKVSEEDGLETILYILQAEEDVKVRLLVLSSTILLTMLQKLAASPGATAAYGEVVLYRDLLLLADLASISQQKMVQQAGSLSDPGTPPLPPGSHIPLPLLPPGPDGPHDLPPRPGHQAHRQHTLWAP